MLLVESNEGGSEGVIAAGVPRRDKTGVPTGDKTRSCAQGMSHAMRSRWAGGPRCSSRNLGLN